MVGVGINPDKFNKNREAIADVRNGAAKEAPVEILKDLQLSIDCETLSLKPNALIIAIGWCLFEFNGNIASSGTIYPSIGQQLAFGRDVDPDTLKWWSRQDEAVRSQLDIGPRVSVEAAMTELAGINEVTEAVWGYGSDVDNVWVQSLGQQVGIAPWHFRKNSCGRTLVRMSGDGFQWPARTGLAHCAVDDAVTQAKAFIAADKLIRGGA